MKSQSRGIILAHDNDGRHCLRNDFRQRHLVAEIRFNRGDGRKWHYHY